MATKDKAALRTQAQQIKDETTRKANTAVRVGVMVEDQNDSALNVAETTDQVVVSNVGFPNGIKVGDTIGDPTKGVVFNAGNGTTGFYEVVANVIRVLINNVARFEFNATNFGGINAGDARIRDVPAEATVPNHTWVGDNESGLGRFAVKKPSIIANSIEGVRVSEDQVDVFHGTAIGNNYAGTETPPTNGLLTEGVMTSLADHSGDPAELDYVQRKFVEKAGEAVTIQLPEFIDMVFTDTLQIYYSSMITFPNWERYHFAATLLRAQDLGRYIELTPDFDGDFTLLVNMYDEDYNIKSTGSTTIRIRNSVQQPASTVNYWNVGDSLTAVGTYTTEMHRRLTGVGGTPVGDNYGNIVQHVEGNAGKEWDWYVNDEASPFVYSGVLDFEQYRIDNGLAVPQVLYILLTWNGMLIDRTQAEWDTWDDDVYTFIDALRADFPSVEVKLMSPQFPSTNGGLGAEWDSADNDSRTNQLLQNKNMYKQAEIYERIKGEASYSAWVEHINTALVVDSKYNMQSALKDVNWRNSTDQESIGADGRHPATGGYYQIADAAYRNFIVNYCQ